MAKEKPLHYHIITLSHYHSHTIYWTHTVALETTGFAKLKDAAFYVSSPQA